MRLKLKPFAWVPALCLVAACGGGEADPNEAAPAIDPAPTIPSTAQEPVLIDPIASAIANPARPADDILRDEARKPLDVLAFAGVEPGMTIVEMEAGGGYYTELLSAAVGPEGRVIMQNPEEFLSFLGDSVDRRLADGRLPNVTSTLTPFDALEADNASADLVTWILGPHEIWFKMGGDQPMADPAKAFAEIVRVLKPGGKLLLVDHIAPEGSGPDIGDTLHRIEPSLIRSYAEAAGLTLASSSDVLRNDEDPLDDSPFTDERRGKTSRFVDLYVKGA